MWEGYGLQVNYNVGLLFEGMVKFISNHHYLCARVPAIVSDSFILDIQFESKINCIQVLYTILGKDDICTRPSHMFLKCKKTHRWREFLMLNCYIQIKKQNNKLYQHHTIKRFRQTCIKHKMQWETRVERTVKGLGQIKQEVLDLLYCLEKIRWD